jgi:hypothetical protein
MAGIFKVLVYYNNPTGTIEYDNSFINDISRNSQSVADNSEVFDYSALVQNGTMKLIDKDGSIAQLARQKILKDKLVIEIVLDNKVVGKYISRKWNYVYGSKIVNITLSDTLENWDNINYSRILTFNNTTALDLYNELVSISGETFQTLSSELSDYLDSITIKYCYLNIDTLRNQWNKLCQITQCVVFKNEVGYVEIKKMV